MLARTAIVKAVSPEQAGWRARIAASEPALLTAFLTWVASLQDSIQDSQIAHAIVSHGTTAFEHVLQAVTFQPNIAPIADREGELAWEDVARMVPRMLMSFDLHDPHFTDAVQRHQAAMIREVTTETRRAIANMIDRGYRNGTHPYDVAPQIRAAIGLTARQAQAVLNFSDAQTKNGVDPRVVSDRSIRYAAKMRTRRAKTIARTETARAQVLGRLTSYEQAADKGLFDRATAELEWAAVQEDPTEICAQLDGERVPFGQSFDGLLPPAHPCCRCSVHLVIDR